MKTKFLSAFLALFLCASACFVSCDKADAPEETTQETDQGNVQEVEKPEAKPVQFTLSEVTGKPGETVEIEVQISASVLFNSVALHKMAYDENVLTFKGFSDTQAFEDEYCVFPVVADETKKILMFAMKDTSSIDVTACKILFEINPDAKAGKTPVDMTSLVKFNSDIIESGVYASTVTVTE